MFLGHSTPCFGIIRGHRTDQERIYSKGGKGRLGDLKP